MTAYASWSVVFGEQPSAAKWNILGTNDASFNDGTGIATGKILPNHLITDASTLNTWAEDSWTPTWTNFTTGNGTLNYAKFIQIGKVVIFRVSYTLGSTSSVSGQIQFSTPVTTVTLTAGDPINGNAFGSDFSNSNFKSWLTMEYVSTTKISLNTPTTDATYAGISASGTSSTIPFTWATSDQILASGVIVSA